MLHETARKYCYRLGVILPRAPLSLTSRVCHTSCSGQAAGKLWGALDWVSTDLHAFMYLMTYKTSRGIAFLRLCTCT